MEGASVIYILMSPSTQDLFSPSFLLVETTQLTKLYSQSL